MSNLISLANLHRKGRAKNQTNLRTREREASLRTAMVAVSQNLAPEQIARMSPLDVLAAVMVSRFAAGDLLAAANVAAMLAPYHHAKRSPSPVEIDLPADLQPDPPIIPDEDGPEHPVH